MEKTEIREEDKMPYGYGVAMCLMSNELARRELAKLPALIQATEDKNITKNRNIRHFLKLTKIGFENRHRGLYYGDLGCKEANKCDELRLVENLTKKSCDELEAAVSECKNSVQAYLTAHDCCFEELIAQMVIVATLINNSTGCAAETKQPNYYAEQALRRISPDREEKNFFEVRKAFYAWPDYLNEYHQHPTIKGAIENLGEAMGKVYERYYYTAATEPDREQTNIEKKNF